MIHPTYYPICMSNILLESTASGRPIITIDRSGCREIVDDSKTGYLVETQNTKQLIDSIEQFSRLSYEKRKTWVNIERDKVKREFDRELVASQYKLYIKTHTEI